MLDYIQDELLLGKTVYVEIIGTIIRVIGLCSDGTIWIDENGTFRKIQPTEILDIHTI